MRAVEIVHRLRLKKIEQHKEVLEAHKRRGPAFEEAIDELVGRLLRADQERS